MTAMSAGVHLREVAEADLPIFFEHQLDTEANYMAAFTRKDLANWEAFRAFWARILGDNTITIRTILCDGQVAGHVSKYEESPEHPEVTYWLGKPFWGKGIATAALQALLLHCTTRPIYARAAKDNHASLRVLEKCGFTIVGEDKGFANARDHEVEEFLLQLG